MPRFAANLHYLFTEWDFLDRFAAAADAGFRAVEFQVPYHWAPDVLSERLRANGLQMVLFDAPMGDWDAGDRGLAALPGREAEFRASLAPVVDYAGALGCDLVHVMAGVAPAGADRAAMERVYVANLRHAAGILGPHGVSAVIEPINPALGAPKGEGGAAYTTRGMPGYFLNHTADARRVVDAVGSNALALHLDVYHMQVLEGHLAQSLQDSLPLLRHVQIAGVPGRHEPDAGEINYPWLFAFLDDIGYRGWVGCEYRPRAGTLDGLGWGAPYGLRAGAKAGGDV